MIKTKIKAIMTSVLGNAEQIGSEKYFITITCFSATIFISLLSIVHLIMKLKLVPGYIAVAGSVVILAIYFLARFTKWSLMPKLFLTVFILFFLDLAWFNIYLSNGPVLFLIMIFGALIIWVWEGKSLAILLSIYLINQAVLFLIDYSSSDSLYIYPDIKARSIDIYLNFIIVSSLLIFLLSIVKKDFYKQKERAIKSDNLKSAFLANMSHEIRTPMNAIVGFSQLLNQKADAKTKQQYISIIQNSSDNLLKLINDIIDLSRIEAGDVELKLSDFSLRELFIELKDFYSAELLKRGKTDIQLHYSLPDEDIYMNSDLTRLKQVLSNLLNNAIKFTYFGTITFSCIKKSGELSFSVSDTGTGIPEDDQKRIFDRFTKFNYLGMNTEGTGIGLSITYKLVSLLKGRIWLSSVYGTGTSFFFSIPFVPSKVTSAPVMNSQKSSATISTEPRKVILVVEDDKTSFFSILELLKPYKFEIHHVNGCIDAIGFIEKNPKIDLILMNIKFPFKDDYKVAKEIKNINPNILIIAQAAFSLPDSREEALNAGCNDYITKPLDSKNFQKIVNTYLKNKN